MAGTSNPEPSDHDPGGEEDQVPDPDDMFSRADRRAQEQARQFRRDLEKQVARGAAFELGKKAFDTLVRYLTED